MTTVHRGIWLAGIAALVLVGYSGAAAQDVAVVNLDAPLEN